MFEACCAKFCRRDAREPLPVSVLLFCPTTGRETVVVEAVERVGWAVVVDEVVVEVVVDGGFVVVVDGGVVVLGSELDEVVVVVGGGVVVVLGCIVVEVVVVVVVVGSVGIVVEGDAVEVGGLLVVVVVSGTTGVVGGDDKGVAGANGACVVGLLLEKSNESPFPKSKPRPEIWPSFTVTGTSLRGEIGEVSGKRPATRLG